MGAPATAGTRPAGARSFSAKAIIPHFFRNVNLFSTGTGIFQKKIPGNTIRIAALSAAPEILAFYHLYKHFSTALPLAYAPELPQNGKIRRIPVTFLLTFCLHKVFDNFLLQTVIHILHRVLHIKNSAFMECFYDFSTKFSKPANPTFQPAEIQHLFYIIILHLRFSASILRFSS